MMEGGLGSCRRIIDYDFSSDLVSLYSGAILLFQSASRGEQHCESGPQAAAMVW